MHAGAEVGRAAADGATPSESSIATAGAPASRSPGRAFRLFAKIVHHAAWRLRLLEYALPAIERELASPVKVPARVRPGLWRRGFLSESWVLYDLADNDPDDYLPDLARFTRTRLINGGHGAILDDKLLFDRFVGGGQGTLPRVFGVLRNGRSHDPAGNMPTRRASALVLEELRRRGGLVVKPATGGGGRDVFILRHDSGGFTLNDAPIDEAGIAVFVDGRNGDMACELVVQHPRLAALHPATTNTLRVLTMQDEHCDAFVAAAVMRIGTAASAPTDNWSRGGLSAGIDIASGVAGQAAAYPAAGDRLTWHARHPETGAAIAGLKVPHWSDIVDGVLGAFRSLPDLKYVGWDVVVTEDGFRILEGNNYSDVNLLQVHGPLLADRRVRDFYRRHGVL